MWLGLFYQGLDGASNEALGMDAGSGLWDDCSGKTLVTGIWNTDNKISGMIKMLKLQKRKKKTKIEKNVEDE